MGRQLFREGDVEFRSETRNETETREAASGPLPVDSLDQLVDLAKGQPPERQHGLLKGVADLYRSTGGRNGAPQALGDAFIALVHVVAADIRQALAERLADADWAPVALVQMLATDAIDIARPVIAASPLLQDGDLLRLLAETSLDHRVQVALRPGLGVAVARAILEADDPTVMTALASNRTAALDGECMSRLVSRSRELAALRAPLARHPQMTPELGARLYQWVGEALRQAIMERFTLDPTRLERAARAAAQQAAPVDVAAARLTAKLQASEQLRPATLIRALREDRLEVFIHALSRLARLDLDQVRRALQADTARPLFLACTAAGLDRAAFPAVLSEVRRMNHGFPRDPDGADWRLAERSASQAAYEFQLLMAPDDGRPV